MTDALLFAGTSHPTLATKIAQCAGIAQGRVVFSPFPDHELHLSIEDNVRGRDVFVVQTIAERPNDFLMELFLLADALKRASARQITAIVPYFGYARQDRKDCPRGPITARLVANLLETAGVDHLMTMDLHADQIQGFFNIPVDHVHGWPLLIEALEQMSLKRPVIVAPDLGAIKIARAYAAKMGVEFAVMDKRRLSPESVSVDALIGDVAGKTVVLVDDMCATGHTLVQAARVAKRAGAATVIAACTHGVLVSHALEILQESEIEKIIFTDTIPEHVIDAKIAMISTAPLFGEAVRRACIGESLSSIFH